jgi:hypothetical protein
MIKNYLKTALRNLLRYQGFTVINITSLAIGITACLIIGLFVWDELQYDKNIQGGENIYRIYNQRNDNNNILALVSLQPTQLSCKNSILKLIPRPDIDGTMFRVGWRQKAYEERDGWQIHLFMLFSLKLTVAMLLRLLQIQNQCYF